MRRLPFGSSEDLPKAVQAVVAAVADHGVVLLPTETFYGLGASPTSRRAMALVFALKARPEGVPLPVLVADWQQLSTLVTVPEVHRVRLSRCWPGAVTAVLPAHPGVTAAVDGRLAVRIPGHSLLRALLYRVGPLTGTSANRHGAAPATQVDHALASLAGEPQLVLDGGSTPGGTPSTVVDLCSPEAKILRQGAFPWDDFYAQFRFN